MEKAWILVGIVSLLVFTVLPMALSQPPMDEAAQVFEEAGCTQCHNGGMAPDFQGTVDTIAEWAQAYDNIDEAVQNEYSAFGGADSYDEMMAQMKQYTPGVTDDQFQYLYDFFLQVFDYYKAQAPQEQATTTTQPPETTTETGAAECTPVTVTETVTKTKTETVEVTKTVEKTVTVLETVEKEGLESRLKPGTAAFVPVVAAVLILGALAYAVYTLRLGG